MFLRVNNARNTELPKQFDSWNHKLVTDGGRIYDEYKPVSSVEAHSGAYQSKSLGKIGIILSVLTNLGALCFLGVWLLLDDEGAEQLGNNR